MNFKLHIWKEWLICRKSYLYYAILIYFFVNFSVVSIIRFENDYSAQSTTITNIIRLFIIFIGTVFMLMSMINQGIAFERFSGHIHCLLAYQVPLRVIVLSKAIFILILTISEIPILFLIYFWFYSVSFSVIFSNIFLIIMLTFVVIMIVFIISFLNVLISYVLPTFAKLFSLISFLGCFLFFSFYESLSKTLNDYFYSLIVIFLFSVLISYFLLIITSRIPNQLVLKK